MRNRVTIHIAGESYVILSEESDSYMQSIAALVGTKMTETRKIAGVSSLRASVLAACNIADDYCKAVQSADNLRSQMKNYLEEANLLRKEVAELRRQLASVESERDELLEQATKPTDKNGAARGK